MIRRPDLVEELENRYKREEYSKLNYEDKLGIFLELRAQARLLNPTYAGDWRRQIQTQDRNRPRLSRTRKLETRTDDVRRANQGAIPTSTSGTAGTPRPCRRMFIRSRS